MGSTANEFKAQKLRLASRHNVPLQYQPSATTASSRMTGQISLIARSTFHLTVLSQIVTASGASPKNKLGTTNISTHAKASFGRLISTSRLPASEINVRRFVLDASSSKSPRRGSMIGSIATFHESYAPQIRWPGGQGLISIPDAWLVKLRH